MTQYALRKGTAPNPASIITTINDATNNVNFDCPTNPVFYEQALTTSAHRLFSYVSTDASHSQNFVQELVSGDTGGTQYNNLSNTEGYSIHCYEDSSQTGLRLNSLDSDYDYFVLIHSNDLLQHHFARITEVRTGDVDGDFFDFEPRLGKKIPRDTKFMVFRGPEKTETSIVALSAGVLNQQITAGGSTYNYQRSYICARPTFYFYKDRLDKKGELDHNKKYFTRYENTSTTSATITPSDTNCFVTAPDYNNRIVDYSRYTIKATLVDNLRDLDDPTKNAITSNEGYTLPANDFTDYDECFFNARRDSNNVYDSSDASTLILTGPYRYIHYNYSPEKANTNFSLASFNVFESVGQKGGYAEAKLIDTQRILSSKIQEQDLMRVRHRVHTARLEEFFALKATVNAVVSGNNYTFDTEYDLDDFFSVGDRIKVGDRILIVNTIDSFSSNQQNITFESDSRLENASSFSTEPYTLSAGDRLYRRAWNASKGTLLTTFKTVDGRHNNLRVIFNTLMEATVTSSNREHKTLTLDLNDSLYESVSNVDFLTGIYSLEIERFEGNIEQMDTQREFGQNFLKIYGRSNYSKLISPTVNKNYLFSKDIVYSSNSPYNNLVKVGTSSDVSFASDEFDLDADSAVSLSNGDKLFIRYDNRSIAYIGEFDRHPGVFFNRDRSVIELKGNSLASCYVPGSTPITVDIYKANTKNYIFSKALSADNRLTSFATSLTAATEKGVFFESGVDISDNTSLTKTSVSTNDKAIGYHINDPTNISKDEAFQARLSDGDSTFSTFDTVNTLADFTVVSTTQKDGKTIIELAPYVPITLGRMEYNDADETEITFTSWGVTTGSITKTSNQRYIQLSANPGLYGDEGEPIYINEVFAGYITQVIKPSTTANWRVYVDRAVEYDSGDTVKVLDQTLLSTGSAGGGERTKKTHDLYLVNGAHLHGGKFVSLINSYFADGVPHVMNFHIEQGLTTNIHRHGYPLYRIHHFEKGVFDYISSPVNKSISKDDSNYYEGGSKLKYYGVSYKINPARLYESSTFYDGIIGRNLIQGSSHQHMPVERRGNHPASGSLYFDYNIFESGHSKDVVVSGSEPDVPQFSSINRYRPRDILQQFDPKAQRLFLFATSDLLPYSSKRSDSIFNSSVITEKEDLLNFKLLLLNNSSSDSYSVAQSNFSSTGSSVKMTDENYEDASIIEVDRDITKLMKTGIMRLTEVVFDCAFNQFNPEKPPKSTKTLPQFIYYYHEVSSLAVTVSSYGTNEITVSSAITVADDEVLIDDEGNLIGTANGAQSSVTTVSLNANPIPTDSGSAYTGTLYKATVKKTTIKGHGEKDSILEFEDNINLLRGTVLNSSYAPNNFSTVFGNTINNPGGTAATQDSHLILPLSFKGNDEIGNSVDGHPSLWLKKIDSLPDSAGSRDAFLDSQLHGVFLDRYDIEDGLRSDNGLSRGTAFPANYNTHLRKYDNDITTLNMGLRNDYDFLYFEGPYGDSRTATSNDGEGVLIGFKLRLAINHGLSNITRSTQYGPSGKTLYKYTITSEPVLDYIKDLTGCYLVSEEGVAYGEDDAGAEVRVNDSTPNPPQGINNVMPDDVGYVLSHEIDSSDSTLTHILLVDADLTNGYYRVMQPNETAFYEFTPNRIKMNTLSSEYTKVPYENKTYDVTRDYLFGYGSGGRDFNSVNNAGHNEAVLSMYVLVDPDRQDINTNRSELVTRTFGWSHYVFSGDAFEYTKQFSVCLADGETTYKTSLVAEYLSNTRGAYIEFGEMQEMNGVVSVSEMITITTSKNVSINPKRAMIGSVVSIANEAEDILNDLFESNDLEYEFTDTNDYPLFLAPNYKSVDLFSAINYVLQRKKKVLLYENDKFTVKNKDNSSLYPKIFLSDSNNKIQIKDFNRSSGLFDLYNEIIVYGDSHVSTKRNLRSIDKIGKKTLEFEDKTIFTQEDADEKAIELLRQHSKTNEKITMEIGHVGLSQLRAGDTIDLELTQEGVSRGQYLILEMEHQIDGFIKLELGRFSKGLEDRLAEVLISTKQNRAFLRSKELASANENASLLDLINVRERKLLVQTRIGTSSFNIGFVEEIGFSSEMGFGSVGASIVTTTVREVEY